MVAAQGVIVGRPILAPMSGYGSLWRHGYQQASRTAPA
jgi:hypothetical protein